MQSFTTRPDIRGTFGALTSTPWIASAIGMSILEMVGNAFDACSTGGDRPLAEGIPGWSQATPFED